jgi:hypothetical protein
MISNRAESTSDSSGMFFTSRPGDKGREVSMAADNSKYDPPDADKINIGTPADIRIWCIILRCNEQQLREAVNAVGPSLARIREYLGK